MRTVFEFFIIMALAFCLSSNARAENIRIIVYGDSLTSGYELEPEQSFPARLEQKLKGAGFSEIEVINMSVAGETTAGGVDRLNSLLVQRPDIVILELGSNDAKRGIAINFIYKNLGTIVSKLLENRVYVMLIGSQAPSGMGAGYNQQFQGIYRQIAAAYTLPLYPDALEGIIGSQDLNLADGYHPNAKGVQFMLDQMYPLIDAGVRWKWDAQQQYQQWKQQNDMPQSLLPPGAPR